MKESWTDMFIGCTGKVAKYLCSNVEVPPQQEQFYCWQVTQFSVMGEEILLFMNIHTRFPIFMRDLDGITVTSFQQRFRDLFSQVMDTLHIPKEAIEFYLSTQHWMYGKILDRSVLSQMSDLAYIYKFNVINGNHIHCQDVDASIHYADIPCVKANIYPKEKMVEAMSHLLAYPKKVS